MDVVLDGQRGLGGHDGGDCDGTDGREMLRQGELEKRHREAGGSWLQLSWGAARAGTRIAGRKGGPSVSVAVCACG